MDGDIIFGVDPVSVGVSMAVHSHKLLSGHLAIPKF